MFFEGIRSERQLIETASLNLAHRWYLGYALDEDAARPLQPDPHPAAARHRRLPALLRADRRPLPGGGAGLGPGALLRCHQGRGQRRHPDRSSPASTTKPRPTWPTCSRTSRRRREHRRCRRPICLPGIVPLPIESPSDALRWSDPPWRLLEERRLDPHRPSHRRLPAHERLPRQPHRSRCLPDVGLGRDPPRLPRPLRRRWRQAPHHPRRPGHAGRRHGEPVPMRDLLWRVCFRRKIWPAPGHGRRQLRHHREHRRHRGRRHPGLRAR